MSIVKPLYREEDFGPNVNVAKLKQDRDDYLDLMLDDREFEDVKKSLKVGPLVKLKKAKLNNLVLKSASDKIKNATLDLPRVLMAKEDKPPTLEDYLQLGIAIGNLTPSEREMVLEMLNKTLFKPTEEK